MVELSVILCALAVGSFGNVFLARFPKGESLFRPGSHCPLCGHVIRVWHNIPVLGWLLLRGRCFDCDGKISFRYPAMEAAFGVLAWIYVASFGVTPESLFYLLLLLMLLLISWVDWETQYIFDVTSLPLLGLGLFASTLFPQRYLGWWDSPMSAAAMALGMLSLSFLGRLAFKRDALGGGDIKLMVGVAAFLGLQQAWKALFFGVLFGLPLMLLYIRLRRQTLKEPAPFGPGLCVGTALALWNFLSQGDLDRCLGWIGLDLLNFHTRL